MGKKRWLNDRVVFKSSTLILLLCMVSSLWAGEKEIYKPKQILKTIHQVNKAWQKQHPPQQTAFWHQAAYHTANMEVFALTGKKAYKDYSMQWAEHNRWRGAQSDDKSKWKYSYGEKDDYVLFGDWQICFQTYIDLYRIEGGEEKIARAREVMEYEMSTPRVDYWWWSDGLYMVMPVMSKLYKLTGDERYYEKLVAYYTYAEELMYDQDSRLFYRDARYVYPLEPTINACKNFWSRGNGWVFAAYAKVMQDLPDGKPFKAHLEKRFKEMASALLLCQQQEGYWSRSLLDEAHAPGRETSGTAFFTYGLFWGINQGLLPEADYLPAALKGWRYLSQTALQKDGSVGYVQPIGERAIPGQSVNASSVADFGLAAFLLAACESYRYFSFSEKPHKAE